MTRLFNNVDDDKDLCDNDCNLRLLRRITYGRFDLAYYIVMQDIMLMMMHHYYRLVPRVE